MQIMRLTFEEELPLWVGCPRNSEEARGGMCHEGRRQPVHHCVITIVIIINSSSYYHHMVEGEEKLHITGLFFHHCHISAKFCFATNHNRVINIDMMSASDGLNNTLHHHHCPASFERGKSSILISSQAFQLPRF